MANTTLNFSITALAQLLPSRLNYPASAARQEAEVLSNLLDGLASGSRTGLMTANVGTTVASGTYTLASSVAGDTASLAGVTLTEVAYGTVPTSSQFANGGVSGPNLGRAGAFAVLASSTVTNTGSTTLTGNLGLYPGTSVTGFPPGTFSGNEYVSDGGGIASGAQTDALAAFTAANALPGGTTLAGGLLGGLTLTPGVYVCTSTASLTGTLTLNANGNPNAVWVFQIGSALTTASASSVVMTGGGNPGNVFFVCGSAATLGTTTSFQGNILADTSITVNTGATVKGSLYALTGAVTLAGNTVAIAGPVYATGGDAGTAANLAAAINANPTLSGSFVATSSGAVVTVRDIFGGIAGNFVPMASSSHITVSASTLLGGTGAPTTTYHYGL
jgi:hypothetical protein